MEWFVGTGLALLTVLWLIVRRLFQKNQSAPPAAPLDAVPLPEITWPSDEWNGGRSNTGDYVSLPADSSHAVVGSRKTSKLTPLQIDCANTAIDLLRKKYPQTAQLFRVEADRLIVPRDRNACMRLISEGIWRLEAGIYAMVADREMTPAYKASLRRTMKSLELKIDEAQS